MMPFELLPRSPSPNAGARQEGSPREPLAVESSRGKWVCWLQPTFDRVEDGRRKRTYRVFGDRVPVACEPFHVATFMEVARGVWQPDAVACAPALRGRGITPAIYKRLVADTGGQLRSSSPTAAHQVYQWECITEDGIRVWNRLVDYGDAIFDQAQHRYVIRRL